MKLFLTLALTGLFFLASGGCGESREDLAEDSISVMKEMADTLETVKDGSSAKAAKPKLQELATRMEEIEQKIEKMGTPSDDELKAMLDKYDKEAEEVTQKLMTQMMRIAFDPEIQKVLGDLDIKAAE